MISHQRQIVFTLGYCLLIGMVWKMVPHPVVVMAVGLVPFAMLFVLNAANLIILMFVAFSFFRLHEAFPQLYSFKIPLLLALSSLGVLFWKTVFTKDIKTYWTRELTLFSIFFIQVTFGVVLASNPAVAIAYYTGVYIKIAIMVFAIAWMTREEADFSLAVKIIVISGMAVALVAITNKLNGIGLVEGTRVTIGRDIRSALGDPNDLSLVLMFPMAFAVGLVMTKGIGKFNTLLGLVGVPILFWAVLATQSRGGLLGIMTVFGIYGYRRIKSKILFFSGGALAALVLVTAAGISDRQSGGAAEDGIDESAMGRIYAWEAAYHMALENPFSGVGIDNFLVNYFFYSKHWDGMNHAVHSTWFGVLAETGFAGLVTFVTMIVLLVRTAIISLSILDKHQDKVPPVIYASAQAVLAGLSATIVSGTFLTQGFTWPIYILTALVVAVSQWTRDNVVQGIKHTPNNRQGEI